MIFFEGCAYRRNLFLPTPTLPKRKPTPTPPLEKEGKRQGHYSTNHPCPSFGKGGEEVGTLFDKPPLLEDFVRLRTKSPLEKEGKVLAQEKDMKKILTCILAMLGLTSACGHHQYEDADVERFAALLSSPDVVLLDVRTIDEYNEGHLKGALQVDIRQDDFMPKAQKLLPKDKTIAVYCRSGRRSAQACEQLESDGYKVVNLKGGILAWKKAQKPVE